MPTEREQACLNCTLPICIEGIKGCNYVQITPRKRKEVKHRYYENFATKLKAAANSYYWRSGREKRIAEQNARNERRYKMKRGIATSGG